MQGVLRFFLCMQTEECLVKCEKCQKLCMCNLEEIWHFKASADSHSLSPWHSRGGCAQGWKSTRVNRNSFRMCNARLNITLWTWDLLLKKKIYFKPAIPLHTQPLLPYNHITTSPPFSIQYPCVQILSHLRLVNWFMAHPPALVLQDWKFLYSLHR